MSDDNSDSDNGLNPRRRAKIGRIDSDSNSESSSDDLSSLKPRKSTRSKARQRKNKSATPFSDVDSDIASQSRTPSRKGLSSTQTPKPRSSERLAAKSRRRSDNVHLSRRDIFDQLSDDISPIQSFRRAKKNDFTKENNSYNYERGLDGGYDMTDGFLVSDDDEEEEEEEEEETSSLSNFSRIVDSSCASSPAHGYAMSNQSGSGNDDEVLSNQRSKKCRKQFSSSEESDENLIVSRRRSSGRAQRLSGARKESRNELLDHIKQKRKRSKQRESSVVQNSSVLHAEERVKSVEEESGRTIRHARSRRQRRRRVGPSLRNPQTEFYDVFERPLVLSSSCDSESSGSSEMELEGSEAEALTEVQEKENTRRQHLKALLFGAVAGQEERKSSDVSDLAQLLECIRSGNSEDLVKLLSVQSIKKYARNWTDEQTGFTLMHVAAAVGEPEVLKVVLNYEFDVHAVDFEFLPSVAWAFACGNVDCLDQLLHHCDDVKLKRIMKDSGTTLVHLAARGMPDLGFEESDVKACTCLKLLYDQNRKQFKVDIRKCDKKGMTPVALACRIGHPKALDFLLSNGAKPLPPEASSESLLHWIASLDCRGKDSRQAECLKVVLELLLTSLDSSDENGFTPLMFAAQAGNSSCVKLLVDARADLSCKDEFGTSALHLAALSGQVGCVEALINSGHPIACLDQAGWPPLLYANFLAHEELVLLLMKSNPNQLYVLGDLLKKRFRNKRERKRTHRVVGNLITTFANQDAYYQAFNYLIRSNPSLLDYEDFAWNCRGLLDFANKKRFFLKHMESMKSPFRRLVSLTVDRDRLLESAMVSLGAMTGEQLASLDLDIKFKNELGSCMGPRREFFSCFCQDVVKEERQLFVCCDDSQYSFFPGVCLTKAQIHNCQSGLSSSPRPERGVNTKRLKTLSFIGRIVGMALCQGDLLPLHLARPVIKRILQIPLKHPDDMKSVDHLLYESTVEYLLSTSIDSLDLGLAFTFTQTLPNGGNPIEIELEKEGNSKVVTDENKHSYVRLISKYKVETSIMAELSHLKRGISQAVNFDLLRLFNADEFSLLLNGVQSIDVNDWKKNSIYSGWDPSDLEITWFWSLVRSLKEEEKVLLLKFATGSPCVPAGGFECLQGMSGPSRFCISKRMGHLDEMPHASTCFNHLHLPSYSSERFLKKFLLIAIRHGCEGFSFA